MFDVMYRSLLVLWIGASCSFAQAGEPGNGEGLMLKQDYLELEWPVSWTVFGPISHELETPLLDQFLYMPTTIRVGEQEMKPNPVHSEAGGIDLEAFFLKNDPEYVRHTGDSTYLFAEIHCEEAGVLLAGAGADWWMQWAVDGEVVLDTLASGNNSG